MMLFLILSTIGAMKKSAPQLPLKSTVQKSMQWFKSYPQGLLNVQHLTRKSPNRAMVMFWLDMANIIK